MKKTIFINAVLFVLSLVSCNKANVSDTTSLTASTTQALVGQTISVVLNSNNNASNWTVTPATAVSKQFTLTTQKVNYFTFSQTGLYTIAVRTRNIAYDSTHNQSLDSCWRVGGGNRGGCTKGVDSASVSITVK